MAVDKERIAELLARNVAPNLIAKTVGCSQSYINLCLHDEDFQTKVARIRGTLPQDEVSTSIDNLWDKLELATVRALTDVVAGSQDPVELLAVAKVANAAKRRGSQSTDVRLAGQPVNNTHITMIQLPDRLRANYTLNGNNEIAEVEGRPMVTMASNDVLKLAQDRPTLPPSIVPNENNKHEPSELTL